MILTPPNLGAPANIVNSASFSSHLSFLIQSLTSNSAGAPDVVVARESQLLALLVVQKLLDRITGSHQMDFAHDVLGCILDDKNLAGVDAEAAEVCMLPA